jgi:hypothetical protein
MEIVFEIVVGYSIDMIKKKEIQAKQHFFGLSLFRVFSLLVLTIPGSCCSETLNNTHVDLSLSLSLSLSLPHTHKHTCLLPGGGAAPKEVLALMYVSKPSQDSGDGTDCRTKL